MLICIIVTIVFSITDVMQIKLVRGIKQSVPNVSLLHLPPPFLSLLLFFSTVSPSASLTCASQCKCNGCPAESVSEWQAYSQMWAGNLTAKWKCQMYYRSILIPAVFHCNSQKLFAFQGGIFWHLFCSKNIYVSVCVRVEVELLLTAKDRIYARHDHWFPMFSGNGIWLAESEADAWWHSIGWVHRAHYEWLVQYKGCNEKRRGEKRGEVKRWGQKKRWDKIRKEQMRWDNKWKDMMR